MPVDPEIRRLAADPDALFVIRMIDCFFESMLEGKDEATAEQMTETCWRLLRRGVFRLYDEEVDDDDAPIKGSLTPAERERARHIGTKLFAVRQRLRRAVGRSREYPAGGKLNAADIVVRRHLNTRLRSAASRGHH